MSLLVNQPPPNYENPELAGSLAGSLAISVILGSIAVAAVTARLWARFRIIHRLGLDDMMIFLALGFGIAFNIYHEIGIRRNGYGRHIWDIPPDNLSSMGRDGFIATELYLVATALIKSSILLFYRRLLHGSHGELVIYKRINYALLGAVITCLLALGISLLLVCTPLEAAWRQLDPLYASTQTFSCRDTRPNLLAIGYCSLTTDIAIVIFPLLFIRHIQIGKGDRWALRALFCVCIFACIAAVIRTVYQHLQHYNGIDFTYHGFYSLLWGTIEIYIGIICASAPALKPFFGKYLSNVTSRSSRFAKSSYGKPSFRHSSSRGASNANTEPFGNKQNTESDAHLELISDSNTAKPWDARSREFTFQTEAKPATTQPTGVMKQVEVEVKYSPETVQMGQITHCDQV